MMVPVRIDLVGQQRTAVIRPGIGMDRSIILNGFAHETKRPCQAGTIPRNRETGPN